MVKVYDNIIPGSTCKKLLDLFEKNEDYQERYFLNHTNKHPENTKEKYLISLNSAKNKKYPLEENYLSP